MNFTNPKVRNLLPALAIAGALFLNVANAHILLLIWVLYSLVGNRDSQQIRENTLLVVLLYSVWITLAQFWSGVGSIGWYTTWTFLALPMAYIGWQFHSRNNPAAWPFMINFIGLLGTLLGSWGIIQVLGMGYSRAVGPLSDPNAFGCLLNLMWFPLFARFLSAANGRSVNLFGIALLVIQMAIMMSGSRTASLIWLLLFATMLLLQWKVTSRVRILIICVFAVGNYFIYSFHSGHLGVSSYQAAIVLPHAAEVTAFPRWLMWQSTINMWLTSPWIGGGLGSWNYIYPAFRLAGETGTAGYFAHNDYLQILQEGGAVLFVFFVGLLGWLYIDSLKKLATSHGLGRIENLGILAGITAVILHATVNFSFYLIYINILVGIYFGILTQVPPQPSEQKTAIPSESAHKFIIGMSLIIIIVNGFNGLLSSAGQLLLRNDSAAWKIVHMAAPGASPYSIAALLISIRPSDTRAQRYVAASLENEVINNPAITLQQSKELYNEIIDEYESLRIQNKYDPSIPADEAGFLIGYSKRYGLDSVRTNLARGLLQDSLLKDPSRVDSVLLLNETYTLDGNLQAAYDILAGMLPKVWRERDKMIIEAEIMKMKMPQHSRLLSDMQNELRGMRINCGKWECGNSYSKIEKSARQTLDDLSKE